MNTIIPNKLSFNLEVENLPARAEQIDLTKLHLLEGQNRCDTFLRRGRNEGWTDRDPSVGSAEKICPRICRDSAGRKFTGHFSFRERKIPGGTYQYKFLCRCC